MSLRRIQFPWLSDVFTTPTNTPVNSTNATFAPPSGAGGFVMMTALARNAATGNVASIIVAQSFKNVTGTVTMSGTLSIIMPATGDAGMTTILADFIVTGATTVVPRATGIAGTSVEWLLDVRYWLN